MRERETEKERKRTYRRESKSKVIKLQSTSLTKLAVCLECVSNYASRAPRRACNFVCNTSSLSGLSLAF